ncbi:hypothetical protein D9757_006711 [Collybiopsis confluens]|uniref:Uncharacterized protein n=1 Tax=Collybiopsis confluens TaxID=2823264 RepID=A0A8H5HNQ7_9AGAR|nr:hypothetical protein D9757_006711 [Collybiopsis confluens]
MARVGGIKNELFWLEEMLIHASGTGYELIIPLPNLSQNLADYFVDLPSPSYRRKNSTGHRSLRCSLYKVSAGRWSTRTLQSIGLFFDNILAINIRHQCLHTAVF